MTAQVHSVAVPARPSPAEDLLAGLAGAFRDAQGVVVGSLPAPLAPLETLLGHAPLESAVLWDPSEGPSFAALGAVEIFRGKGASRLSQIRRQAEAFFSRVTVLAGGEPAPVPRCFGGMAFTPGAADAEPWAELGDACFVVPRFQYSRSGDRAWLSVFVRAEECQSDARRRALAAATDTLLGALRQAAVQRPVPMSAARRVVTRSEASADEWQALVEAVRGRIVRGDVEKVVLARCSELVFDSAPDPAEVLSELVTSSEHCTRFAFRQGRATFLGASPERLVRRTGLAVDTEALAGSNRPDRATELLESAKEHAEHAPVLREIVKNLAPLCAELDYPRVPEVRALRHLLHLRTPIRGRLLSPMHVLELVERLHPTPAVGGTPAAEAVRLILESEPSARGWYAAPIGWFGPDGDGEFAVALRSGMLVGERAYLYAGGGIVRDSDPAAEYAETRLKLAALSTALRVG